MKRLLIYCCLFVLCTPALLAQNLTQDEQAVWDVLDELHAGADAGDFDRYFGVYAPNAVFLGTDATERWTLAQFKDYTRARFAQGKGWTYHMTSRHVFVHESGETAWFDETLHNENLGDTRGSGVLIKGEAGWKISQYNLTIPVPNDLARQFVARIQAPNDGTIIYLIRHAEKADDGTSDPPLTPQGEARADVLASYLSSVGITHLHTSDFKRTRQTVAPMAERLGLEVVMYNPRDLPAFAEHLKGMPGVHVVSGHSNTTPALVKALGGDPLSEITESEYDRLYQVIIRPGRPVESTLLHVPPFDQ